MKKLTDMVPEAPEGLILQKRADGACRVLPQPCFAERAPSALPQGPLGKLDESYRSIHSLLYL